LGIHRAGNASANPDSPVPDGGNLAQIQLFLLKGENQPLCSLAVVGIQLYLGGKSVCVKAKGFPTLLFN
jgi:hypothetical protein